MDELAQDVKDITGKVTSEVRELATDVVGEVRGLTRKSGRLIHELVAHSYLIYLASIVIGFAADLIWPVTFSLPFQQPVGIVLILLGTTLAVWAQMAANKGAPIRNKAGEALNRSHFSFGPYMFTHIPTQYGLLFMTLGLALLYGFLFMLLTSIGAFLLGTFVFVRKQEKHLAKKYGDAYLEYKKRVKF